MREYAQQIANEVGAYGDTSLIEFHKGSVHHYSQCHDYTELTPGDYYLCHMYNGHYMTLKFVGIEGDETTVAEIKDVWVFEFDYVTGVKIEFSTLDIRYVFKEEMIYGDS